MHETRFRLFWDALYSYFRTVTQNANNIIYTDQAFLNKCVSIDNEYMRNNSINECIIFSQQVKIMEEHGQRYLYKKMLKSIQIDRIDFIVY